MSGKRFLFCVIVGLLLAFAIVIISTKKVNENESKLASRTTTEEVNDDAAINVNDGKSTEEETTEEVTEVTTEATTEEATEEETYENDVTAPIFTYISPSTNVAVGSKFNIHDFIGYADDLDSKPKLKVKGKVDTSTVGTYPVKVTVKDHAGNKVKQELSINVYQPAKSTGKPGKIKYDWYKFKKFKKNYKKDNTMLGIDVSRWQNDIDFNKVAKDGCKFVIMRIGGFDDGELYQDRYYAANIRNAKAAGLKVGIYWHAEESSVNEVKEHVPWIMNLLNGEELDFPIAYDWEDFANFENYHMSLKQFNETYFAFAKEVEKYGYEAMMYSSKNYLMSVWETDKMPYVWLAHYTDATDYPGDYFMWQKGSTGKLKGIETYVDLDVLYTDRYEFKKYPARRQQ